MYAKVDNNIVTEVFNLKEKYNNVSFPNNGPSQEWLEENNLYSVTVFKQHDRNTEKLVSCEPYFENNQVFLVTVQQLTEEEINSKNESQWANIRSTRNNLLKDSDWTALVDVSLSTEKKSEWAIYRQALRDITNQQDPFDITWPTVPNK